jgi:hypothetical protein
MAKKRIILISVVCFSIAVFAGQTSSQKQISPFPPMFLPGMTVEEHKKEMEKWHAQRQQQEREENWRIMEFGNLVVMELRKQTLGVTKQQWRLIEPKYKRVETLRREAHVHILTRVSRNRDKISFHWKKLSVDDYFGKAKAPAELTEGEKIAEELIDLLEDENSTEEVIRQKMDSLQQVREKAQKELPKSEQELAKLLSPRQEAVLLLWEFID